MNKLLSLLIVLILCCPAVSAEGSGIGISDILQILPSAEPDPMISGDYEYILLADGTVEITDYSGEASELDIPVELDSYTVSSIGSLAFSNCDEAVSVTIPASITHIGDSAFKSCDGLTSITIPDTVITIGANPFRECDQLTDIRVSGKHPYFATIDGVLFEKSEKKLVCYPYSMNSGSYIIPEGIAVIGEDAFMFCDELTDVVIPSTVTRIEDSAFCGCKSFTQLNLPESVTFIGEDAFNRCESITEVVIPSGVTVISNGAFSSCDNLASVVIPEGVTTIHNNAFSGCESLTEINLPSTVTHIGWGAFRDCDSITGITIPDSVTVIAENPFPECDMLTDINVSDSHPTLAVVDGVLFSKTEKRLLCYPYAFTAESYAIPQGIQIISQEAFLLSSLKNISIPDSVVNIDNLAFGMCENLTSVDLPDSVTRIGEVAFFRCEALTEVVIPASTVVIEDYAFDSCPNLTLTVEEDSYAEQYAVDNELVYEYAQDLSWLND